MRSEKCRKSNAALDSATQDEQVMKRLWNKTKFSCDKCSFKAQCAASLLTHSRYHSSEKPFKCPNLGCDYKTRWAHSVPKHQQWCRGQVQIPTAQASDDASVVPVIDKSRREGTTELSVESVNVTKGEPLASCPICGFTSRQKHNLRSHLLVHTDHKPFHCPAQGCKFRTKWSYNLTKHSRQFHHVEPPPTKSPLYSNDNSERINECETEMDIDANDRSSSSSSSLAFACMLCDFVGDSELSALEHARQHTAVHIPLDRNS